MISFFTTSDESRIEYRIVRNLYEKLSLHEKVIVFSWIHERGSLLRKSSIRTIFLSQILVVSSPLVKSSLAIVFARLLRVRVMALIWDHYPVTLGGRRYDSRIVRIVADLMENFLLRLCEKVFVPSSDFKIKGSLSNAISLRMWPRVFVSPCISRPVHEKRAPIKIVFAGQVNATRGLNEFLNAISAHTEHPYNLFIASSDVDEGTVASNPNVTLLGYCDPTKLKNLYRECDLGLVSLSLNFNGPAFPSKTFDYISNGLPILYHGPRLPEFLRFITESGIGFSIDQAKNLDHRFLNEFKKEFDLKANNFLEMTCVDNDEIQKFLQYLLA
jgi:hypothetical protein